MSSAARTGFRRERAQSETTKFARPTDRERTLRMMSARGCYQDVAFAEYCSPIRGQRPWAYFRYGVRLRPSKTRSVE